MGNSASVQVIPYAVPINDEPESSDRTQVYRSVAFSDSLVCEIPGEDIKCGWDILLHGCAVGGDNHEFIGSRLWDEKTKSSIEVPVDMSPPDHMGWLTYRQVVDTSAEYGCGLVHMNFCPMREFPEELFEGARRMFPLGIFSKNRPEWFLTEYACAAYGLTLVPLYETLGDEALAFILSQTRCLTVCASGECAMSLLKRLSEWRRSKAACDDEHHQLRDMQNIICFDKIQMPLTQLADQLGVHLYYWKDVLAIGHKHKKLYPISPPEPNDIVTICYTSGTTGKPKGVLLTARNFTSNVVAAVRGCLSSPLFQVSPNELHISYLPLAHVFERVITACVTIKGGRIGTYSGDTMKLLEDMKVMKPTVFLSVPRLFMRINDKINSGLTEKSPVAQFLFNSALSSKLAKLRTHGVYTHTVWDSLVFGKLKKLMGGNVRFMIAGGAPLDTEIQERISAIFCCPLLQGFGMTELGATIISLPGDPITGHIGGVQPCNEICLESVSELNYFVDSIMPTGELLVRGYSVTPGYFRNPEATAESFTEDNYFKSGDIATLLPGGCLKIVDRKKNIFKLAQGEYIAPEKIEMVYVLNSPFVSQIFVHGDSCEVSLVAIVVPDEDEVAKWCVTRCLAFSGLPQVCENAEFKQVVAESLEAAGVAGGLKGFEKVKAFLLEHEPFSIENGLLTPTLKLKRPIAKQHYQKQLNELYQDLKKSTVAS